MWVKCTGRGVVVKRPGVLSKVQMLNLVLGVGVFSLLQLKGGILWTWFFLQKERIFQAPIKLAQPFSGPRIADKKFTDTRIFLNEHFCVEIAGVFITVVLWQQPRKLGHPKATYNMRIAFVRKIRAPIKIKSAPPPP